MSTTRKLLLVSLGSIALGGGLLVWSPRDGFVIGERTAADGADRLRARTGDSPLPAQRYEPFARESGLLDPVRVPLDSALAALARRYAASDAAARARMRGVIDMDGFYELHTFSQRAAVFALRERSTPHLRDGLAAIAMLDAEHVDPLDIQGAVALLYHVAGRIGADGGALFNQAAALADAPVAQMLTGFPARPDRDLRASWMMEEVRTPAGPGFVRRGFEEYRPTLDLLSAAVQIAEVLQGDVYLPGDPEIATELPPVWLRSADQAKVAPALERVRAATSVSAIMRPGAHPDHEAQMLPVFLVEMEDEASARALADAARQAGGGRVALLGVAEGRLFCLAVGRSFVEGVDAYETAERLARFRAPLGAVLRRHAGQP